MVCTREVRWSGLPGLALICLLAQQACAPISATSAHTNVHPDPSRDVRTENLTKEGEYSAETELSGDTMYLKLSRPQMCSTATNTPMRGDVTEKRELTDGGRTAQWWLGGSAVVLGGLGVLVLTQPCTTSDTDASGNEVDRACTTDEAASNQAIGIGLTAVGAAAAAFFTANAVSAMDGYSSDQEAGWRRAQTPWEECGSSPVGLERITLSYSGGDRQATTDAAGVAVFRLGDLEPASDFEQNPIANVTVADGTLVGKVDFRELASFPAWVQRFAAAREERKVALESSRQEEQANAARARQVAKEHSDYVTDMFGQIVLSMQKTEGPFTIETARMVAAMMAKSFRTIGASPEAADKCGDEIGAKMFLLSQSWQTYSVRLFANRAIYEMKRYSPAARELTMPMTRCVVDIEAAQANASN